MDSAKSVVTGLYLALKDEASVVGGERRYQLGSQDTGGIGCLKGWLRAGCTKLLNSD